VKFDPHFVCHFFFFFLIPESHEQRKNARRILLLADGAGTTLAVGLVGLGLGDALGENLGVLVLCADRCK
jgi:hypothetical protein